MKTLSNICQQLRYLTLFSFLMLATIVANAQNNNSVNTAINEIKLNLLGVVIGLPELSYERLLNDRTGVGISAAAGIQNDNGSNHEYKFIITPHYHYYFGKKQANGFFLEANTVIFSDDAAQADDGGVRKDKIYYGLGAGLGYKQLFGKGFLAELLIGVGSKLNNKPVKDKGTDLGLYKRLGLSIGKRF